MALQFPVRRPVTVGVAFAVLFATSVLLSCTAQSATRSPSAEIPVVDTAVTPPGWIAISYGNAQISVPSTWTLVTSGSAGSSTPATGGLLLGTAQWATAVPPGMPLVRLSRLSDPSAKSSSGLPTKVVNGIDLYAVGLEALYEIPALGAQLTLSGPVPPQVLESLTYSPRAVAVAPGSSSVPKSWRWIGFDGLRLAVPVNWHILNRSKAPACSGVVVLQGTDVVLANGLPTGRIHCALPRTQRQLSAQGGGVDIWSGTPTRTMTGCSSRGDSSRLRVCILPTPAYSVLVAHIVPPGHPQLTLELGLSGDGSEARIILGSLRTAKS